MLYWLCKYEKINGVFAAFIGCRHVRSGVYMW